MKQKKVKDNIFRRIVIIAVIVAIVAFILIKAENYIKEGTEGETNLILNNRNVTARLKHDIKIDNDTIYLSIEDIKNYFDKYIYYEEDINEIITTYDTKIASIGYDVNKLTINGSIKKIYASAIKEEDTTYLPISEMGDVYNIETANHSNKNIVTIDSLNRAQTKAYTRSNQSVKWKKDIFSKTVDKISKGDVVVVITQNENGWAKIRTENGEIGYIKASKLTNFTPIREDFELGKQIEGKVNMFWDYFSQYVQAPDRTGQTIEGINVVSPSFFYINSNGELKENVGTSGTAYIEWAHSNGYKVWPMLSNAEAGIKVTSEILNSYEKRQALIENIVEKCVLYDIDGINVDFENMYEADKDKFSRFVIELMPRMQELGIVISVDVTAPDGGPNWSMCYDRNVLGDVADYLVFMAYDQYGTSSTKPGTTAGYNWIETSLKKIIDYDVVDTQKIILGMPLYTRIWTINQDGSIASRNVVNMIDINKSIPSNVEKQWDDELKQYYVEYQSGKTTKMMWIEDGASIAAKVGLVTKYNLGGASCWEKDRETSNIWTIIREELEKNAQ